ncbi:MAG: class I SAM-dependent methyltransferase [Xanthomonadales bacterium]|nr:class I SAM-dependent methyltransferase [Xanthomonadales bacterium]
MSCSAIMFSLFLTSPCPQGGSAEINEAVANAIANPQRPAQDVARDTGRKPDKVLSFFEVKPGMTVFEMFAGGGYYTELLDSLVGEDGKVIAHNNQAYMSFVGEAHQKRHADGRLANTKTVLSEADDLEFDDNSLDAALLVLTWHDFLFANMDQGWQAIDEDLLLDKLCAAMKPGAVLGLVDHVANPGGDRAEVAQDLHRVDPQVVKDSFADSCFSLEAEAEFLRNKDDDHTLSVFDPAIRGKTDRFVYKFVRK